MIGDFALKRLLVMTGVFNLPATYPSLLLKDG